MENQNKRLPLLSQDFELGFTYTRSTGPVIGRFLSGLRERRIYGSVGSDGGVIVPPAEYDPKTAEALSDNLVEVAQSGEVTTWCWVLKAHEKHPLDKPFAWALILLDGAATPMLHAVAAENMEQMRTGMRVKARWVEEPQGLITDIACFEPEDSA